MINFNVSLLFQTKIIFKTVRNVRRMCVCVCDLLHDYYEQVSMPGSECVCMCVI